MPPALTNLEQQAINAAKQQNWQAAIDFNKQIIEQDATNMPAMIRQGVALVQLGKTKEAKKLFQDVLELDKTHQLAKKHLQKLQNNQTITLSSLPGDEQFIEEPGKTKTVELHRLVGKEQLEGISVGQICDMKPKNRFISVELNGKYIGSLPEDLSSRLTKLIKGGNIYACYIRSISSHSCGVFIKELERSKSQEFVSSFPVAKSQANSLSDMYLADDNMPLELEAIPIQIVETDNDEERTPTDTFPTQEETEHPDDAEENDRQNQDNDRDQDRD